MKIIVCFLAVMFFAVPVIAQDITLSWTEPEANADGTALTDLEGYILYSGTESRVYTEQVNVGNVTTYKVKDVGEGIKYFAVSAVDTSGNEGLQSKEVSTLIVIPPSKVSDIACQAIQIMNCVNCISSCEVN